MQTLKELVLIGPDTEHDKWFEAIARLLFYDYVIATKEKKYRITEVEFYYYSENHKDETTYGFAKNMDKLNERLQRHKKAQCKQFTWFFHYSGIDLVIGKQGEPGGILIRALEDLQTKEKITGPLVVLLELLNQQIDIEGKNALQITILPQSNKIESDLILEGRKGLGDSGFKDKLYNFSVK